MQLGERLDAGVARADEDEPELGRRPAGCGGFEPLEDMVAQGDRIGKILEPPAVLDEPGHGKDARHGAERDDEPLVGDLVGPAIVSAVTVASSRSRAVARPEEELGVRAHLSERHDDVTRLERPGGGLGQEWGVEHRVLRRDDRGSRAAEQAGDVRAGEAAAEHERPAARLRLTERSCPFDRLLVKS